MRVINFSFKYNQNICGIYLIWNPESSKGYVGQSVNILRRYWSHKADYINNHNNLPILHKAFDKYGINNFEFYLLEECPINTLNDRECYWISEYDTLNNGYNVASGGNGIGRGVDSPNSTLTVGDVECIINLLKYSNKSQVDIAKIYNVSKSVINRINLGESYIEITKGERIRDCNLNYCEECGIRIGKISSGAKLCKKCYGKSIRGENHYKSYLSNEDVLNIKNELKYNFRKSMKELSEEYGTSYSMIKHLNAGRSKKYVGEFDYPIR